MKLIVGFMLTLSSLSYAANLSCDSKSQEFAKFFTVRCDEGIDHYVIKCSKKEGLVMVECSAESLGIASKAIPCDCKD